MRNELTRHLEPVVAEAGLFLEGVSVSPAGRRTVVRVVVDLADGPGGVSSDALAEVSREVSRALDGSDLLTGPYTLEVTTPGVDRPLTDPRHFRRAVGRLVAVTTGAGTTTGRLTGVRDDVAVLDGSEIPLSDITGAVVQVEFRED
ncbi:MAG: ribosome maturation factor RimP [Actinobacteria bacterium]|nr:ribosome maturation factor RimP [Actinomycetota bacterium]